MCQLAPMSLYDYLLSQQIDELRPTFSSLIMAALRKADTTNAHLLRAQWPTIAQEMQARYDSPGGVLPQEQEKEND